MVFISIGSRKKEFSLFYYDKLYPTFHCELLLSFCYVGYFTPVSDMILITHNCDIFFKQEF